MECQWSCSYEVGNLITLGCLIQEEVWITEGVGIFFEK